MIPFSGISADTKRHIKQYTSALTRVAKSGTFIHGPETAAFERMFASYCTTKYCVGVGSGTDALRLALRSLGIGPGDEVIVPAMTFVSTAFAVLAAGARPVVVDVSPRTLLLDPELASRAISRRTRAIIPVHLYGMPADMDALNSIAKTHKLNVIEDAAQAHGSMYAGRRAGSLGDIGCFSFYPSKNLGAFGDGGAVVTKNRALFQMIRAQANLGETTKYRHNIVGSNSRLDTIQAAVLLQKLSRLDKANATRRKHAARYTRLLSRLPVSVPHPEDGRVSNYHLYVIRTKKRTALRAFLKRRGIETGVHYPVPLHLQPALTHLGYTRGDFPVSEHASGEILSLPMYPELTTEMIRTVCAAIQDFFSR